MTRTWKFAVIRTAVAVLLLVPLCAGSARAQGAGVESRVSQLENLVATLQSQVAALQTALTNEIAARQGGDTNTLNAAKSYADTKVATEASARQTGDASTLASAKAYADAVVASTIWHTALQGPLTIAAGYQNVPGLTTTLTNSSATDQSLRIYTHMTVFATAGSYVNVHLKLDGTVIGSIQDLLDTGVADTLNVYRVVKVPPGSHTLTVDVFSSFGLTIGPSTLPFNYLDAELQ